MNAASKRIADALVAQAAAAQDQAQANPFLLNQPLEMQAQAAQARAPISTPVEMLMKKLGLLSMIRNRGNAQMVDPGTY